MQKGVFYWHSWSCALSSATLPSLMESEEVCEMEVATTKLRNVGSIQAAEGGRS